MQLLTFFPLITGQYIQTQVMQKPDFGVKEAARSAVRPQPVAQPQLEYL